MSQCRPRRSHGRGYRDTTGSHNPRATRRVPALGNDSGNDSGRVARRALILIGLFLVTVLTAGISPGVAQQSDVATPADLAELSTTGTTMGKVQYHVRAFANRRLQTKFENAVVSALELVNDRMSTYKLDSEVSLFNMNQKSDWFPVSLETATVVSRALEISQATGGAFDITVGPLVNLWKFGPDKSDFGIPADSEIQAQLARVGYQKLAVRLDPPALRKNQPAVEIDLSAIAKGYAVDLVTKKFDELGIENYLVEVGGEVRTRGTKPNGRNWRVGIERPTPGIRDIFYTIPMVNRSLASSGDYRNFFEYNGVRYSHTIDPRTGEPVRHELTSVSVLADDCLTADAVATAVMVLGAERGLELVQQMNLEALALTRSETDIVEQATPGFPKNLMPTSNKPAPQFSLVPTIITATFFFLLAVLAMSIGALVAGKRLKGSCGGIAALDDPNSDGQCAVCSTPKDQCSELKKELRRRGGLPDDS